MVEVVKQDMRGAVDEKVTRAAWAKRELKDRVKRIQVAQVTVELTPFSVFGKRLSIAGGTVTVAEIGLHDTAVVDPAGLDYIQPEGRPGGVDIF